MQNLAIKPYVSYTAPNYKITQPPVFIPQYIDYPYPELTAATAPIKFPTNDDGHSRFATVQNAVDYYNRKDYLSSLLEFDKLDKTIRTPFVLRYLNNQDFKALRDSRYFNTADGFKRLADIVYTLEKDNLQAKINAYNPFYRAAAIPDMNKIMADISVENCLKNINNLFKSQINEQEKYELAFNPEKLKKLNYSGVALAQYLKPDMKSLNDIFEPVYM